MVMTVAQHFNDLLMRLRAFGLPIVGTIAGVGFTLGGDHVFSNVPGWVSAAFVTANAVLVVILPIYLLWLRGWGKSNDSAPMTGSEKTMWLLVPVVAVATAVAFWSLVCAGDINATAHYSLNARPIILFFALAVLVVLYVLDRFYYYKLLLGAVYRASDLEIELGYKTTSTITDHVLPQQAATIITLLYFLPGITGYCLLLILVGLNPLISGT